MIAEMVRSIVPYDVVEQEHHATTVAWIDSGAPLCRIEKPATPPQHLVSYFVLYEASWQLVLLVDHTKAGLWLPNGGHVEPGEHPHTTVIREAREELQITARFVFPHPIFLTVTQTVGSVARHTDISLWYVLQGDAGQTFEYDQEEFRQIAWFSLADLPVPRTDPHMQRFAAKLQAMDENPAAQRSTYVIRETNQSTEAS
jgi:8-oxo-dGTP pyrophosphatase MutT (NUDIX family)